jgi:hypothetical protein
MAVAAADHAAIFAVSSLETTVSRRKILDLPSAAPESTHDAGSLRRAAAERRRFVQDESRPVDRV